MVQISGVRRVFGVCILAAGLIVPAAASCLAQDGPLTIVLRQGQSDADIKHVLDLATQTGRPVTVQMEGPQSAQAGGPANNGASTNGTSANAAPANTAVANTGTQSAPPAMEMTPEMGAANMGMASWERFSGAIIRGATVAVSGLLGMSAMMGMTTASLDAEGSSYGWAGFAALLSILAGGVVALLLRVLLANLFRQRKPHVHRVAGRFRRGVKRLAGDVVSVGVFLGTARMALKTIDGVDTLSFQIGKGVVTAAFVSLIYVAIARFLFKPDSAGTPLIDIRKPSWHFHMLVAYGVIGAFLTETLRLAYLLELDRGSIDGGLLIGNTVLTLLKLTWFIGGAKSIREAFIGARPGIVRRVVGNLLPEFYVVTALLIWLGSFLVAGTSESARWAFAAGSTQVILLVVPILALGAHAVVDEFTHHCELSQGHGLLSSMLASLRVVLAGAAWIGGLHLITSIWWPLMGGEAMIATAWITWLERFSLAVVASWAVYTLVWRYSESIAPAPHVMLPGQEDEQQEKKPTSRLSTALPVVRNLVLGAVLAVAALIILSSAGINVAPLLAGFGVVGLALSFGSQALVKDVVSGIFFIADDAFRIGEYINTGKLQGTVEQITVRSVRLRHHNGPIHTIPFGQISSVSNFSRDWGTIKFQLRFERDADAELIRKTAKKVGLTMLEDPEMGPEFLIPLKMQGIQDITETSMIVRFKFTCLPGNPSILKREAMKRLIFAFKAAGLEFASNAVTVRSGTTSAIDAAAAASMPQTLTPVAM